MRNRRLRKVDAFFNVTGAQARSACLLPLRPGLSFAFLQSLQDSAAGRIGNRV